MVAQDSRIDHITPWRFPDALEAEDDLVAVGADLEPETLLAAYRRGLFPMPVQADLLGWWSPDPRGVFELETFLPSRSLRRARKRYEIRFDTAFAEVIKGCAKKDRAGSWIDSRFRAAYTRLHEAGHAHSVEAWDAQGLAGGLYGVSIGGFFAAESKFYRRTDASKAAVVGLIERMLERGGKLLDVQWLTPHLERLGASEVSRKVYFKRLNEAIKEDVDVFSG